MSDYIKVTIDVLGESHEARVRHDLPVADLIKEIKREFESELQDRNLLKAQHYVWLQDGFDALPPTSTVADALTSNDENRLVFGTKADMPERQVFRISLEQIAQMEPKKVDSMLDIKLTEETSNVSLKLNWMPIVVGRDGQRTIQQLTNLKKCDIYENLHPQAMQISRDHAVILEDGGNYYIVPLQDQNPVYLATYNEHLEYGKAYMLQAGERLAFGNTDIVLVFNKS